MRAIRNMMRERGDRVAFALAMWLSLIYRETGKGLLLIYLEAKEFERPCPQFKWFCVNLHRLVKAGAIMNDFNC